MKRDVLVRAALVWLGFAAPAHAHVVSMSTSELIVDGRQATYELHMPLYEIQHVANPSDVLLGAMRFRGGPLLNDAKLLSKSCHEADGQLVCTGIYQFPSQPSVIDVECRLAAVTVPNHVHVLSAKRGDREDQAVFDLSFQNAELRFEPPSYFEKAARAGFTGLWRAIAGPAQWLFLLALVIASRRWRELMLLAAMFVLGEIAAQFAPAGALPPRFLEAAAALTIAYLAVEILWLAGARARWAVVAVLGGIHGLYFAQFARTFVETRPFLLGGVVCGELIALGALGLLAQWLPEAITANSKRPSTWALFAIGLVWFGLRLVG